MKTKILGILIPPLFGFGICLLLAPFVSKLIVTHVVAADFSGPERVSTNRKLAPTDYHFVAWYDREQREWLRVQGKDDAHTITEQWGPRSVTIESTYEPSVARTATGWIIVFNK